MDELSFSHPSQHHGSPRRNRARIAGMVAGGVVIVLVLVIGVQAVLSRTLCEQNPVRLRVATSLDVAPAVERIGQYFNNLNRDVGGHCAQVQVTEDPPDSVAAKLAGTSNTPGETTPDAWIPDSSLWMVLVRDSALGATVVRPTGVSVARSPLVIAVPRDIATGDASQHLDWQTLMPLGMKDAASAGLQIQLPDPAHSAVGLAALVQIRRMISGEPDERSQFTRFVRGVTPTASLDDPRTLASFASLSQPPWNFRPVSLVSEQAVGAYNQSSPSMPLTAYYPGQEYDLDYPFVLTTSSPLKIRAAQQFEQVLKSSLTSSDVRAIGFRSAGGQAGQAGDQFGIVGSPQPTVALAAPGEAGAALQAWDRLAAGSRQLVLDDISGVMALPLQSGGASRMRVIQDAASIGLSLDPDSTQIGVWEYSYRLDGSKPYRAVVPVGPLPEQLGLITRRQQLEQMSRTLGAQPGAPAATYAAIVDGFEWMTANYQPGRVNALIVLGSGAENAPNDLSLSQTLARLRSLYDPQRPVEIIMILAGSAGNEAALQQIARVGNGAAYVVQQPSDMLQVFFNAIGRRMCQPNC